MRTLTVVFQIFSEPVHLHGVLGETKLASVLTCQSAQLDSNATPAECGLRYDTGQIISHWNMAENTNKSVLLDHTAVAQRKGECERASSNYYDTVNIYPRKASPLDKGAFTTKVAGSFRRFRSHSSYCRLGAGK